VQSCVSDDAAVTETLSQYWVTGINDEQTRYILHVLLFSVVDTLVAFVTFFLTSTFSW